MEFWTTLPLQTPPGSFRFEVCLFPTAVFKMSSQVFYGIQIWTQWWPFQNSPFVTAFWSVLGYPDPVLSMTSGGDAAFWHWTLHCAPKFLCTHQISWCHSHSQGVQCQNSKTTPKHLWPSTMFDWRDCVLFFEALILFSVNNAMMCFTKKALLLTHLFTVCSSRRIVASSHKFWQTPVCLFYVFLPGVVSSWVY